MNVIALIATIDFSVAFSSKGSPVIYLFPLWTSSPPFDVLRWRHGESLIAAIRVSEGFFGADFVTGRFDS
jgi:hypothetical protein